VFLALPKKTSLKVPQSPGFSPMRLPRLAAATMDILRIPLLSSNWRA
jgi:hypothetical protein